MITDAEKILFSVSVQFKIKVKAYLARLTVNKYLHQLPRLHSEIVKQSQSACLGNKTLPEICSHIFTPPKKMVKT